jgi:hypothetical protein
MYKGQTLGGRLSLNGVCGHWVQGKVLHLYIFGKVEKKSTPSQVI